MREPCGETTHNLARHSAVCWCGEPMPVRARWRLVWMRDAGSRRISHNMGCRRNRDRLLQQLHRRQRWRAECEAEITQGCYSRDQVWEQLQTLDAEIEALERTLGLHRESAAEGVTP